MVQLWHEFYQAFWEGGKVPPKQDGIGTDDCLEEIVTNYSKDLAKIVNNLTSGEKGEDFIKPERGDRRFDDPEWQDNPVFNLIKQSYLLNCKYARELAGQGKEGLKKDLAIENMLNALSPTNFPALNPVVIRETIETKGENIHKGLNELFAKLGEGDLVPNQTDKTAFKIGRNIANTEGAVVFENELFQLIEYYPTQENTYETPLLIVPPWINKYYIFDLAENKSFVKWNLDQGRKVYLISWVNADPSYHDVSFETFLKKGILKALKFIHNSSGRKVNTLGFCVGGIALACSLALLKEDQKKYCASATFLATPFDFSKLADLSFFISQDNIHKTKKIMDQCGILPGTHLMQAFSCMRDNDLIWANHIKTYLLGKKPKAIDFLFWNSDSTNLPKKMHYEYLSFALGNDFIKETGVYLSQENISLHNIDVPNFIFATKKDHIVPWESSFSGAQVLKNSTFVLGDSGHVAGIINHPIHKKYNHWIGSKDGHTPEMWFEKAEEKNGSWWESWSQWLKPFDGCLEKAIPPQNIIEKAPGRYATDPTPRAFNQQPYY
jgi:polyhydroxyalkanoate synthase